MGRPGPQRNVRQAAAVVPVPPEMADFDPLGPFPMPVRRPSWGEERWHVDEPIVWPTEFGEFDDVPRFFREHLLRGHAPERPLLRPEDRVVTIGSCFARELRRFLDLARFEAGSFWVPSGLNNTFAILDFVSWCVTGEATAAGYRYERDEDGVIREWTPAAERERYRAHFEEAGAFVLTLGLSEVWSERGTGRVFWRGVPEGVFDEDRHEFRRSTVEENAANIARIVELIRLVNPGAPIVLTLSPVPLTATFGATSVVTADCVSKATLRIALDQVLANRPENVYYWPAFELFKWGGPVFDWRTTFTDTRHPRPYLVYTVLDAFVEVFYGPDTALQLRRRMKRAQPHVTWMPHPRRIDAHRFRRLPRGLVRRTRRVVHRLRAR